ncbi:flagellar hook-length control protein FliK [Polynucleobacter sp. HIN8]|uniref:flagellar hook-length control protein FliK n=1 Tax=Polynucleobacter sp. HIN8 TaxID=3047867 RepID=UPI0025724051|nr:flagellar hook-length control protein FliK [Polynucleobacter sp. HIN8]
MPKNEPRANPGGLEDFINELNQATNLRLRIQDDAAQEGRVKIKKNPETKESKPNPELQILQKPDGTQPNPANIAVQGEADSETARANLLAALQQLQLQNPNQTNTLLSQWGTQAEALGPNQTISMMNGLDLEGLRAKLQNLGFDALLNRLETAKASGNAQEIAAMEERLAQSLLAKLTTLNPQTNDGSVMPVGLQSQLDAKALMALIAQRDSNTSQQSTPQGASVANVALANPELPVEAGDAVRVLAVEPSLAQELKIKQLMDLDQKFTLGQGARALGEQNVEQASSLSELIAAQSTLDEYALKDFNLIHGASAKPSKDLDLLPVDDASGNFLSAAQTAQASAPIATSTQIALSMQDASMVRGPLHQEIMTAAKAGGGRIQLELTPPEQGTIRIDLRIDQSGRAHLIVEGANDAAKARLDQGGQQLKQEFAQMGLNLTLDLRQGEGRFAQNQQFGSNQTAFNQPSYSTDRSSQGIGLLSENSVSSRWFGDASGGSSGINLYA